MSGRSRAVSCAAGTTGVLVLLVALSIRTAVATPPAGAGIVGGQSPEAVSLARVAAAEGKLVFRLTTPDQVEAILGAPEDQSTEADGDTQVLIQKYDGVWAVFGKRRDRGVPFCLMALVAHAGASERLRQDGEAIDIGEGRTIVLADEHDLVKFDSFQGFAGVSLVNLDLREHAGLLATMPFDSRTVWPKADRLPVGFEPARRLEDGKDPGLGVRGLHREGIDGRGVCVAIIDQPLTPSHREFAARVKRYQEVGVSNVPAQMHGPPVASIAVGRTCGVAPGAGLFYFAVPMWGSDNGPYCDAVDEILEHNAKAQPADRVRVVSISTGGFARWTQYNRWKETLRRAAEGGVLVITCEQKPLQYATLARSRIG